MKKILINLILVSSIFLLLYFTFSKTISIKKQNLEIEKYELEVNNLADEEINVIKKNSDDYNKDLYENNNFSAVNSNGQYSQLQILKDSKEIGSIHIPKINVNLPIYEGTTDDVLQKGIGHLLNTSLPTGKKGTHSVLVGHNGISKAVFFDDLDKLEIGDYFYIKYLDNIFNYKIKEIRTILPTETQNLKIYENEELVTLVTCTPRYINTHRLVVTGARTDDEIIDDINWQNKHYNKNLILNRTLIIVIIALIIICLIFKVIKMKGEYKNY